MTILVLASSAATASADYVEIERPYSYVDPLGVNSSGVVLAMGSTDLANPQRHRRAVHLERRLRNCAPSPSAAGQEIVRTVAYDINDQGRIVGITGYKNPSYVCTSWQSRINRGTVWAGAGVLTELGGLPHAGDTSPCVWTEGTGPEAINGAGVVLGRSEGKTVTAAAGSSTVTPLPGSCPTTTESAMAINDAGTVVLQCSTGARTVSALGVVTDLPAGFSPVRRGITPSGVVLGRIGSPSLPAKVVGAFVGHHPAAAGGLHHGRGGGDRRRRHCRGPVGQRRHHARHAVAARRHRGGSQHAGAEQRNRAAGHGHRHLARRRLHHRPRHHRGGQSDAPIYRIGAGRDTLEVELSAATADGRALESGGLTEQETFNVRVTLKNTSTTATIKDLNYAGGAPLTIDARSIAHIGTLSAPAGAPPTKLGPGESATFDYQLTAATDGVAAAIVKITGKSEDGTPQEATGSLKLTVTQAARLNAALAQWARLRGMDSLMLNMARKLYQGWDKRGLAMQAQLRKVLSPAEQKRWFGTTAKKVVVDNLDISRALLMGRSPNATAAQFPNESIDGIAAEELYDEYNKAFKAEVGKGVAKYVKKWEDLGSGAKKQAKLAYAESGLAVNYIMNSASQDQREEAEAMVLAFSDGVVNDTKSYAAWTKNEASNLLNDGQAVVYTLANMDQGAKDFADAVSAPFERDAAARREIAKYADTQPRKWQRETAKLDAKIFNAGAEAAADTIVGGAATRLITTTGKVVQLGKKGAALLNMAKATDVVDETGKLAKGIEAVKDTKKALDVGVAR